MDINKNNYENYFLSYIDKELSASAEAAVESFVRENPSYANELTVLQKAKLNPEITAEQIIFPNKVILYRLPEMEATLSPHFKSKLYKQPSTLQHPNFKNITKATILSVAAIFIVFVGYHFNQSSGIASLSKPAPLKAKSAQLAETTPPIPAVSNLKKLNKIIIVQAKRELKNSKIIFNSAKEPASLLANINSIVTNKNSNSMVTEPASILNEIRQDQNNISAIYESAVIQNEILANEPLAEARMNTEAKDYQVLEIDETDRTLYIANFEIDGNAFRGLSRKFNALLKRNRLAN